MKTGSTWGLLGPDRVPSNRRTRTLGLGRAVRRFNELAVPGLGGVWYGRQVLYNVLAMAVVERLKVWNVNQTHIQVANAIEAVACSVGYRTNKWSEDWRMRGRNKLSRDGTAPTFQRASQSRYYVSQPMRMSTAQALPSLGLATSDSARFSGFRRGGDADAFLESSIGHITVGQNDLIDHLCYWVRGSELSWKSEGFVEALNPLRALDKDARSQLRSALLQGASLDDQGRERRRAAWQWVGRLHNKPTSFESLANSIGPEELDAQHWQDLRAGAKLIEVRDAAVAVLDAVERDLESRKRRSMSMDEPLRGEVKQALHVLAAIAAAFLSLKHHDEDANRFCSACVAADASVLRVLLQRDDQVLCLVDDCARPGPAYSGHPPAVEKGEQGADEDVAKTGRNGLPLPMGVSYRIENLYLLRLDLDAKLGALIASRKQNQAEAQ